VSKVDLDAMLDATAFVASVYHRDKQGVRALLDANRSSPPTSGVLQRRGRDSGHSCHGGLPSGWG